MLTGIGGLVFSHSLASEEKVLDGCCSDFICASLRICWNTASASLVVGLNIYDCHTAELQTCRSVAKAFALLYNPSFAYVTPRNGKAPALCGDTPSRRQWPIFLTCYNFGFQTSFLYNELPVNRVSVIKLTMPATIWRGKPGNEFNKIDILTRTPQLPTIAYGCFCLTLNNAGDLL